MGEKVKKPFYKRWYVWVLAIIIIFIAIPGGNDATVTTEVKEDPPSEVQALVENEPVEPEETEEEKALREAKEKEEKAAAKAKSEQKAKEESIPREYTAALKKAETYAAMMHMSKAGIYEQLTSEYGENFPIEAAQYAIDNIVWDWKENALKKAESYAEMMSMSNSAIYDQLVSEYGEKFTPEEAQYAIDNLE